MTALAFATMSVCVADLWQRLVDAVYRRWGQTITLYELSKDGWFTFGILTTGNSRDQRYWHWWRLKLPCYGYRYSVVNDDYRWSRLYIGWWKGEFRHGWEAVYDWDAQP